MRRVIEASYLQPIVQTTRTDPEPNPSFIQRWEDRLFPNWQRVHITKLELKQDDDWPELYRVRFRASQNSSLHMFANDVHMPFAGNTFYNNNCGRAWVTITKILKKEVGKKPQQLISEPNYILPVPNCLKARGRRAILEREAGRSG